MGNKPSRMGVYIGFMSDREGFVVDRVSPESGYNFPAIGDI